MRRRLTVLAALLCAGGILPATPADAAVADGPCSSSASGDFNGDGFSDLAVGVPEEDVAAITDAGAVSVIYGSADGLQGASPPGVKDDDLWHQDSSGVDGAAETGDRFGACLAAGNFNGDVNGANQVDDLAIGVPGEDVGTISNAGSVAVIYGSVAGGTGGLAPGDLGDQIFEQDSSGILGQSEGGDAFGAALTVGDFNGDGKDDLAIGVPGEDLGSQADAGAVNVIRGTQLKGLHSTADQYWHQDSGAVLSTATAGDRFGSALTAGLFNGDAAFDLAVGVPGEDGPANSGAVTLLYGTVSTTTLGLSTTGTQHWTQNATGVSDDAEAQDSFGRSLAAGDFGGTAHDDLAVGVPGEDLAAPVRLNAGAATVIPGSATGLAGGDHPLLTQDSILSGPVETSEAQDMFGSALVAANFGETAHLDLAIGVRGEDVGAIANAGGVDVVYGTPTGLNLTVAAPLADSWNQDSTDVENTAEAEDFFGSSLAAGNFNNAGVSDIAIGIPKEDITATNDGAVAVIYGLVAGGLNPVGPPVDQLVHQGPTSPIGALFDTLEANDMFGSAA